MSDDDAYFQQIRAEFVDEANDNFTEMELILGRLESKQEGANTGLNKLRRPVHSVKGSSAVAKFPLVTTVMHRLEDYLSALDDIAPEHIDDIRIYIDKAREVCSLDVDQHSSGAELVRELPKRAGRHDNEVKTSEHVEALLVVREKMAGLIFERELEQHGLHVITVRSSFEALEISARTRPDLVLVSGVLDELSGIDVVIALKSMPKTRDLNVCLFTSSEVKEQLPEGVFVIQKASLKTDIETILKKVGIH